VSVRAEPALSGGILSSMTTPAATNARTRIVFPGRGVVRLIRQALWSWCGRRWWLPSPMSRHPNGSPDTRQTDPRHLLRGDHSARHPPPCFGLGRWV